MTISLLIYHDRDRGHITLHNMDMGDIDPSISRWQTKTWSVFYPIRSSDPLLTLMSMFFL